MISVVVPVKNRSVQLKRCIESVLSQDYTDFELIIIDDKSDENIPELLKEYNDNRIKYVLNDKNISNANVCRNIGIDLAKGEYVAMLDSDDAWYNNHLSSRKKFIEKEKVEGCFGSVEINRDGKVEDLISRPFNENEKMINYLFSGGFAPTPTHFYKTEAVKNIKFNELYFRHQDWDFSIRYSEKYSFVPFAEKTCKVFWDRDEGIKVHAPSSKLFIETYGNKMNRSSKNKFLISIINQLNLRGAEDDLVDREYFRDLFLYDDNKVSLNDFLSIQKKRRGGFNIINRLIYYFYYRNK